MGFALGRAFSTTGDTGAPVRFTRIFLAAWCWTLGPPVPVSELVVRVGFSFGLRGGGRMACFFILASVWRGCLGWFVFCVNVCFGGVRVGADGLAVGLPVRGASLLCWRFAVLDLAFAAPRVACCFRRLLFALSRWRFLRRSARFALACFFLSRRIACIFGDRERGRA